MPPKKYQDQLRLKKRKKRILKLSLVAGGFFLILAGLVYFLFLAEIFDVRSVVIESPETISKTEIETRVSRWLDHKVFGIRRSSNSMVFSAQKLGVVLLSQLPRIESVDVSKKSLHELEIIVTGRKPEGIWCLPKQDQCFIFDKNGLAYDQVWASEGFILTTIIDQRNRTIGLGSEVAPKEWFGNILAVREYLPKIDLVVIGFLIPEDSFDEFTAHVSPGGKVLFSHSTDIQRQINSLAKVLKEKITKDQLNRIEYFDLRIQDRIYYK